MQGLFLNLKKLEALGQVFDGGGVGGRVAYHRLVQVLQSPRHQDEEAYCRFHGLAFKSIVKDAVIVGEEVDGDEQRGACLPVRVSRGLILRGVGGKLDGDPPYFPILLALLWLGAITTLKVGSSLLRGTLVPRVLRTSDAVGATKDGSCHGRYSGVAS